MTDNRYGDEPLGKSVEEVENEQGNRVNSPVPGEVRRDQEAEVAIPPIIEGGGGSLSSSTPAIINPAALIRDGSGVTGHRSTVGDTGLERTDRDGVNQPMPDRDRGTSES